MRTSDLEWCGHASPILDFEHGFQDLYSHRHCPRGGLLLFNEGQPLQVQISLANEEEGLISAGHRQVSLDDGLSLAISKTCSSPAAPRTTMRAFLLLPRAPMRSWYSRAQPAGGNAHLR